jgi:hypothetical protein
MSTDRKDMEFIHHFDTRDIFQDRMITMLTGEYSLDIIKLDDWMVANHGYDMEKHGSLNDFIFTEFGRNAAAFIKGLLE